MRKFQVWWVKLGCFLTGYDFYVLSNCSEVAVRKVKKYTSALIIVSIIWAFVGYSFCGRYLKLDTLGCVVGALISVLIVVQIERQILMNDKASRLTAVTRSILALLMAIIGSLIIDQIIFKDDIDKAKLESNQREVQALLPLKTSALKSQMNDLDSVISNKELERSNLVNELNANPVIKSVEVSRSQVPTTMVERDTVKGDRVSTVMKGSTTVSTKSITNPKFAQLEPLDEQIKSLRLQKAKQDSILLHVQSVVEKEVKSKVGFIDELKVMIGILTGSWIAIVVYLIWFCFLLVLELLILVSKWNDKDSDYEITIRQQMELHRKKLDLLMTSY